MQIFQSLKIAAIIFLLPVLCSFFISTEITVKGVVKDAVTSQPIPGATISEKGTSQSVSTGSDGSFSINLQGRRGEIKITAIGFTSQSVTVSSTLEILQIKLQPVQARLEEVVVTGYSVKRKSDMTGSVTVSSQPLMGNVAGVAISDNKSARRKLPMGNYSPINRETESNTEEYDAIYENKFLNAALNPLSTFSIDVDAASYSNVRRYLMQGQLPPAGSVRTEELINYFNYEYPQPRGEDPFSINTEISSCPWNSKHQLVSIGLQGKIIPTEDLPASNLVFLIDVSGSMMQENKLPLVKASLKLLTEQLREQDKVAMVVYAGSAGQVLSATSGAEKRKIKDAIDALEAGGSTAGGAGIKLAYKIAAENFVKEGNNRVILCTDGDFNVGVSSNAEMEKLIEKERGSGVFLTVLGYGMGNYKDSKMQLLADKGNGNHAYIDGLSEAKKVLVNEFGGTLFTIAKDVKLQIEFNASNVQSYRLIGYENRLLNKEDFNDDKKDAGDLGSGHTVTALYEIIPVGVINEFPDSVDALKYQQSPADKGIASNEIMHIKFRYKKPAGNSSCLIEATITKASVRPFKNLSDNTRFAAAVAQWGMLLNNSNFSQRSSFENTLKLAESAASNDSYGYKKEFITLIKKSQSLAGKENMDGGENVLNR